VTPPSGRFVTNPDKQPILLAPVVPPQRSEAVVVSAEPHPVSFMDLRDGQCRWGLWEGRAPPPSEQFYCGEATEHSYCHAHAKRCYDVRPVFRPYADSPIGKSKRYAS
jgi:hypothetical protein